MNENLNIVYNALKSSGYTDIGNNEEEFAKLMRNSNNRQLVYDALQGEGYTDLGDYNTFTSKLGVVNADSLSSRLFKEETPEEILAKKQREEERKSERRNIFESYFSAPNNVSMATPTLTEAEPMPVVEPQGPTAEELKAAQQRQQLKEYLEETGQIEELKKIREQARENDGRGSMIADAIKPWGEYSPIGGTIHWLRMAASPEYREKQKQEKQYALVADEADKAIDMYEQAVSGNKGLGSVFNGTIDSASRRATWDMGVTDATNAETLYQLSQKSEDELTSVEKATLDAVGLATAIQDIYGSEVGVGYKIGSGIPNTVAFMGSMALNPLSGAGKKLAGDAVKKFGKEYIKRAAKRAAGDVLEAGGYVFTSGLGNTYANALERINGSTTWNIDDNGYIMYGGQEDNETMGTATLKAIGSTFIEGYSERLGDYMDSLFGLMKGAVKGVKKGQLGKFAEAMSDIEPNQLGKKIKALKEKTLLNGTLTEIMEEEIGMAANAFTVGDYTFDKTEAEETGKTYIFDPETQFTTAMSCVIVGGTINGVEMAADHANRKRINKAAEAAEQNVVKLLGDAYTIGNDGIPSLQERLNAANADEKVAIVNEVFANPNLTSEQKQAVANYALKRQYAQTFNSTEAKAMSQKAESIRNADAAYDTGYDAPISTYHDYNNVYKEAEKAIEVYDSQHDGADLMGTAELFKDDLNGYEQAKADMDEEQRMLLENYFNARKRVQGIEQGRADKIAELVEKFKTTKVEPFVVTDANGNRTVTSAIYKGQEVHITAQEGNVATILLPDGRKVMDNVNALENVQTQNADEMIELFRQATTAAVDKETEKNLSYPSEVQEPAQGVTVETLDGKQWQVAATDGENVEIVGLVFDKKSGQWIPNSGDYRKMTREQFMDWQKAELDRKKANTYEQGDELVFYVNGEPIDAEITGIDPDGNYYVHVSNLVDGLNKAVSDVYTAEELRKLTTPSSKVSEKTTENESTSNEEIKQSVSEEVANSKIEENVAEPTAEVAESVNTALSRVTKDANGNPLYEQTDADTAWDAIVEETGGDAEMAQRIAEEMVADKKAALTKMQKGKPKKGATVAEKIANEKAHIAAIAQAEQEVAAWEKIAQTEARRREAAMSEADRYAAEMEQKNIIDGLKALGEPQSLQEYVLAQLAGGAYKLRWNDKENGTKGFGSHTGLSTEEMKARLSMIDNKNGLIPEEIAHSIVENMDASFGDVDVMDVTNMVIDAVSAYASRRAMLNGMVESRAELLRQQERAEQEAKDAWYMEQYGATEEELIAYNELMNEIVSEYAPTEEELQNVYSIFAEQQLEYGNEGTTESISRPTDSREGQGETVDGDNAVGEGDQYAPVETAVYAEGGAAEAVAETDAAVRADADVESKPTANYFEMAEEAQNKRKSKKKSNDKLAEKNRQQKENKSETRGVGNRPQLQDASSYESFVERVGEYLRLSYKGEQAEEVAQIIRDFNKGKTILARTEQEKKLLNMLRVMTNKDVDWLLSELKTKRDAQTNEEARKAYDDAVTLTSRYRGRGEHNAVVRALTGANLREKLPLTKIDELFEKYNSDANVAELYRRVRAIAEQIGLDFWFDDNMIDAQTGGFRKEDNRVRLNAHMLYSSFVSDQEKATTIVHEILHAVADYAIETQRDIKLGLTPNVQLSKQVLSAANTILNIYEKAVKGNPLLVHEEYDNVSGEMKVVPDYGTTSAREMLMEISNPEFRDKLMQIEYNGRSVWQRIWDAIKSMFTQSSDVANPTAYDSMAKALDVLINEFSVDAYQKYSGLEESASRVYHGSGALFDKFDHSFMGTGEGNQAFGWGTYVSEAEGVGKTYAKIASKPMLTYKGQEMNVDGYENPWRVIKDLYDMTRGKISQMRADAEKYERLAEDDSPFKPVWGEIIGILKNARRGDIKVAPRRVLYSVEIPDDNGSNYLKWHENVPKEVLAKAKGKLYEILVEGDYKGAERELKRELDDLFALEQTGQNLYGNISAYLGSDKEASQFLHEMGYVGLKYPTNTLRGGNIDGTSNYVIFDENDLEIVDNIRFRDGAPFFSNAERAVENIKQNKATPEQWLAMIKKDGGLKAGEDKWMGLSDWLNEQKAQGVKTLTKDEVLSFIRENQIEIEEVNYEEGVEDARNDAEEAIRESLQEMFDAKVDEVRNENPEQIYMSDIYEEAFERVCAEVGYNKDDAPFVYANATITLRWYPIVTTDELLALSRRLGFSYEDSLSIPNAEQINSTRLDYTTEGLDNKKEIAFVVPNIESWNQSDEIHFGDAGEGRAVAWVRFGETTADTDEAIAAREAVDDYLSKMRDKYNAAEGEEMDYMADEELERLQKLTSKEIDLSEKKVRVLVIDEVQSKRHDEGRSKGYSNLRDYEKQMQALEDESEELYNRRKQLVKSLDEKYGSFEVYLKSVVDRYRTYLTPNEEVMTAEEVQEWNATSQDSIRERTEELKKQKRGIPDAPFDKNYHELVMKRMLRYAAENGFDKVAWTKGVQQAKRYNIGSTVDRIKVSPYEAQSSNEVDGFDVTIETINYSEPSIDLFCDKNGIIQSGESKFADLEGKHIGEVLGKSVAEDILSSNEPRVIDSFGIRIGGEGMKGFYDEMIPRFMNKYTKKWGAKVGEVTLPEVEEAGRTMWSVDVTPEMRESVMQGQPMFREGMGAISDREVSYENDPIAKWQGKPRYYGKRAAAFAERERARMQKGIEEAAKILGLEVEIITDASTLKGRKAKAKGWYDINAKKVVVVVPNHVSKGDAVRTVLHEGVAHHGLRELFGDGFDAMLDNIYNNVAPELKARIDAIAERTGVSTSVATEEYLASLAEETNFEEAKNMGWWAKIKNYFVKMLNKLGMPGLNLKEEITDNELRYLLWRSYQNLVDPNSFLKPLGYLDDVAKQKELKVGNYAENTMAAPRAAEGRRVRSLQAWIKDTLDTFGSAAYTAEGASDILEILQMHDGGKGTPEETEAVNAIFDNYGQSGDYYDPQVIRTFIDALYEFANGETAENKVAEPSENNTTSKERNGAVAGNSSFEGLKQERSEHLSRQSLSSQVSDANLAENTETAKRKIKKLINEGLRIENATPNDIVRSLGRAIGMKKSKSSNSFYSDYYEGDYSIEGHSVRVRLSQHPANAERFGATKTEKRISIVVFKDGEHKGNVIAPYSEYTYHIGKLTPNEIASSIINGLNQLLKGGGFDVDESVVEHIDYEAEGDDILYRTSEEIEAEYPNWMEGTTTDSGKHSTQVEGTRKTYNKVGDWIEENIGKDVAILDASSGMGYGTADLRERGFNIEDVEPYQSEERKKNNPATYSSYADIDKKYDFIISNAVLNVIPDDWRRDVLHNMAERMNDGGKLFINTRKAGEEKAIKDKIELDTPQEVLVKRNGKIASYQKFFTPQELKAWVESELGDGYIVEVANKKNSGTSGLAAVVVTKKARNSEEIISEVEREAAALGVPVRIVRSVDELPDEDTRKRAVDGQLKGYFDPRTGEVALYEPNTDNANDAKRTVLHEIVGHKGLRELIGEENYDKMMVRMLYLLPEAERMEVLRRAERHGWNAAIAMDEYLAEKAEEDATPTWWGRINSWLRAVLRNIGFDVKLTDADVKYLLWRSRKKLVGDDAFGMAFNNKLKRAARQSARAEAWSEEAFKNMEMKDLEGSRTMLRAREVEADRSYESAVRTAKYKFQESTQDSMLGLKEFQEAIEKISGKKIADYENAYMYENRMSSVILMEMEQFKKMVYARLLKAIRNLELNGAKYADIVNYLLAKSGLEANEVYARRDAKKAAEGDAEKEEKLYQKNRMRDYGGLTALVKELGSKETRKLIEKHVRLANELTLMKQDKNRGRDIKDADLKAKEKEVKEANKVAIQAIEAEVQQMVNNFETEHNTDELWDNVRTCTQTILNISHDAGIMSDEVYNELWTRRQYYVPLRGFSEKTAEDVYLYLGGNNSPYNAPIKSAYGRTSKADDPIATIGNMAESAIVEANRNRMKQRFLYMVERHRTDLASISDLWVEFDEKKGEWNAVFAEIPEDATPEEAKRISDEFEERMTTLAKENEGKYAKASDQPNIPYRVVKKADMNEHQVIVRRNGKDIVITVNGNPRAAQAINGMTNPEHSTNPIVHLTNWINRNLSANFTMRNPAFMVSNFVRDGFYTNSMVWAKENPMYAKQYNKNWAICTAQIGSLVKKFKQYQKEGVGLDMSNDTERMFYEFMMNGGETGYTVINSVENYKGLVSGELKKLESGALGTARRVIGVVGDAVDTFGRWAEDTSRFAAFMTSRQMGRSLSRSIYDAKEISVNFNKKGSGARMAGKFEEGNRRAYVIAHMSQLGRQLYVFWNAGVQGMYNFGKAAKNAPDKFAMMAATYFGLGIAIAALFSGDDDDDEYYNLPEYIRRNNICLRVGNKWITLPLPIEIRAIYGMGELAYSYVSGKEKMTGKEATTKIIQQVSQIMPIDMMADGGGAMAFVPSAVKPIVESVRNVDWTGKPIYREETEWNKDDPTWTLAFKSTSPEMVALSRFINEITNENTPSGKERTYNQGWADNRFFNNPAIWEHLLEGYLGGVATVANQTKKSIAAIWNEDLRETKNVPVVSRFLKDVEGTTKEYSINNGYYEARQYVEKLQSEIRREKRDFKDKDRSDAERTQSGEVYLEIMTEANEMLSEWKVLEKRRKVLDDLYKENPTDDTKAELDGVKVKMKKIVDDYRGN